VGEPLRMIGAMLDLTVRNTAEAALAKSEERLRFATEAGDMGFWDVDLVRDELIWPARTKAMFGISPGVAVTLRDFYDGIHPDDSEATFAAFAAAADAGTTGDLAVVAGSCGPGNLHLINGLYDAQRSRVPVLAIAAHIPTVEIGTGYFQETHPQELFRECSVYVEYVADPSQMPRLMEIAMRAAIEERGVAVLVIPGDVALSEIADDRAVVIERTRPLIQPSPPELEKAATMLNAASKVTILAGAGVEGAHDEVIALADALGAPIVHALRGKEFIEYDFTNVERHAHSITRGRCGRGVGERARSRSGVGTAGSAAYEQRRLATASRLFESHSASL